MVVSIQTESSFLSAWKGGAHRTRVCSNIHVQYVTHTYWRTEEERADRGGAKSAVARTYNDDACFDCTSTPWGSVYARGGVIWCSIWKTHGTHTNESGHAYEWVMAHICMSHGTHMHESWHTYERVVAHLWMSHGSHMNESWLTYVCLYVCV